MNAEDQEKEFGNRRQKFLEKYKLLIEEYQCDFISYPQYVPNDKGTYDLRIAMDVLDKKYASVKSPFI